MAIKSVDARQSYAIIILVIIVLQFGGFDPKRHTNKRAQTSVSLPIATVGYHSITMTTAIMTS